MEITAIRSSHLRRASPVGGIGAPAVHRVAANRLFAFSSCYLFALFAALLASSGNRPSPALAAPAVPRAAGSASAAFLPNIPQAAGPLAGNSISITAGEA